MFRVAGHSRSTGSQPCAEDAAQPLFINCCGYQHFITKDFSINRPQGRIDYQLLYIYRGCGRFYIQDKWEVMPAGSIVLYRPHAPQIYTYSARDLSEIYWLHFAGTESDALLEKFHIQNCIIGENRVLKQLFDETILELQLHKPLFQDIALSNFLKMLPLIRRLSLSQSESYENSVVLDQLIIKLNTNYMDYWDISSMARFCNLSTDYFSHLFKKAMGSSPIQFLTSLRIEKAKELLLTEGLTVSEVAALVGYRDPMYFSKVFKKATGSSPKSFHGGRRFFNEPI